MSGVPPTTPIQLFDIATGKVINLRAVSTVQMRPVSVIAQIPPSAISPGTYGLTLTTSPNILIDNFADLTATKNSPGIVLGTVYSYNLVKVARYVIFNGTDAVANALGPPYDVMFVDYLPGISYDPAPKNGLAPFPNRFQVMADALVQFNKTLDRWVADNNIQGFSPGYYGLMVSPGSSNLNGSARGGNPYNDTYWGIARQDAPNTVLQNSFILPGNYLMNPVNHYDVRISRQAQDIQLEWFDAQKAGDVLIAAGMTMQHNPYPALTLDSDPATDSTIATKVFTNNAIITGNVYDVAIVYNYTTIYPAPTTTSSDVTTIIQSLEPQTPQYLITQLLAAGVITGNAANWGLLSPDGSGTLLNQFLSLDPTLKYTVVAVVSISVDYSANVNGASPIVIRTTNDTLVKQFLQDPTLQSIYANTPVGSMIVMDGGNVHLGGRFISPNWKISDAIAYVITNYSQSAPYTFYWTVVGTANLTITYAGSSQVFQGTYPAGDVYGHALADAMKFFGLKTTQNQTYALIAEVNTSTPYTQYGLTDSGDQGSDSVTISSRNPTLISLEPMVAVTLAKTSLTQGPRVWMPSAFTVQNVLTYWTSTLPLTRPSSGHIRCLTELGTAGSATAAQTTSVYMPWQIPSTLTSDFNLVTGSYTSSNVTLFVYGQPAQSLGNVARNYTAAQYQLWARYLFPSLPLTLVTCMNAQSGHLPPLSPLDDTAIPVSSDPFNVYVFPAISVVINGPQSINRLPLKVKLPSTFTVYDVINYSNNFWNITNGPWDINNLPNYGLYEVSDSNQQILGISQTLSEVAALYPSETVLQFQWITAKWASVSVTYNGLTTVLAPMPAGCTIAAMVEFAEQTLSVQPGTLEVYSPSSIILTTDRVINYTTPATSITGFLNASFVLQQIVKTNVVVYDSVTTFPIFNQKLSQSMRISQLIGVLGIDPSYMVLLFTYKNHQPANGSVEIQLFERAVQPSDASKLNTTDPSAVTTIVELVAVKTLQTTTITVQPLFNVGKSVQLTLPLYSTAAALTSAAVTAFGNLDSNAQFSVVLSDTMSTVSASSLVSNAHVYQLVEITVPRLYTLVSVNYLDQVKASAVAVYSSSTPLSKVSGIDFKLQNIALTIGGSALTDMTIKVGDLAVNGQLKLYDSLNPPVVVHVSVNGVLKRMSVPVTAKISDLLSTFNIPTSSNIIHVKSGKTSESSAYIVDHETPYTFNVELPRAQDTTKDTSSSSSMKLVAGAGAGMLMVAVYLIMF